MFGTPNLSPASNIPQVAVTFPRFSIFAYFMALLLLIPALMLILAIMQDIVGLIFITLVSTYILYLD